MGRKWREQSSFQPWRRADLSGDIKSEPGGTSHPTGHKDDQKEAKH